MTIEQIQRHLVAAAEEATAPPTRVVVADVYRAGLRRRRTHRWFSVMVAVVAVGGVAGGAAAIADRPGGSPGVGPGWDAAAYDPWPPDSPVEPTCALLAERVFTVARSALPAGISWGEVELPEGAADADCASGGLFWTSFRYRGQERRLGFEGGIGQTGDGCDPGRPVVFCEKTDDGEVGHLSSEDEYGVLMDAKPGIYFFLGFDRGGEREPLGTDELSTAARRIAERVFGG